VAEEQIYNNRVGFHYEDVTALADDATVVLTIPVGGQVVGIFGYDDSGNALRLAKAGEADLGISAVIDTSARTCTIKNELGAALTGRVGMLVVA
jgi:hypothetical protein